MSTLPTYFIGVDPCRPDGDEACIVFAEYRDGQVHIISATTDPDEIASLLADTDHTEPPSS